MTSHAPARHVRARIDTPPAGSLRVGVPSPRVFAPMRGPRRGPLALDPRAFDVLWEMSDAGEVTPEVPIEDSVAVVEVRGPLAQFGGWFFDGYDRVLRDFRAALASPATSVALVIGSPGGDVEGLFECARTMRNEARASGKPVVTYADESAYSAAYALACVGDAIYLPESGGVGSIGVIGEMVDASRALEKQGVAVTLITSGSQKADGHPSVPLDHAAVKRAQVRVDQLASIFFAWVGRRRGMSPASVQAMQAGCVYGPAAVAAGLADRVCSRADAFEFARRMAGSAHT